MVQNYTFKLKKKEKKKKKKKVLLVDNDWRLHKLCKKLEALDEKNIRSITMNEILLSAIF